MGCQFELDPADVLGIHTGACRTASLPLGLGVTKLHIAQTIEKE
jgi:hypothetical protein